MAKQAKIKSAPVHAQQSLNDTFRAILKQNFSYLQRWEETARSFENTEGVHQMRVSFRRMRSALKTFRFAIPRSITDSWSQDMRNLANQLGSARDLDVFIEEGLDAVANKLPLPGQDTLVALAQDKRRLAYQQVCTMLDSEDYSRFKETFAKWLTSQAWLEENTLTHGQRKRLQDNVVPSARKILDKQERRVLAIGNEVDQNSPPALHQLRIECKKLRYGAEFFAPLFKGMDNYISHMKRLQDLLGTLNDVAVMQQLLETLLAGESDAEVLQYAGGLVGWRVRQYYEIKHSFNERWEEFSHAGHPWWDKSAVIH
jgi:CHAD domain-containing protein